MFGKFSFLERIKSSTGFFISIISVFSLLRIYIGTKIPIWFFINSPDDDLLMLDYSNLFQHFHQWNILSLVKDMSYSLFLSFVNFSGLSYRFFLAILWIISGIFVIYCINKFLTKNRLLLLLAFIFVVFFPIAFDSMCGTRVYRNAIIAPLTIITLTVMFIFINTIISKIEKTKLMLFWGILLGLIFTFTYYIKEDGILTFFILIGSIGALIIFKILSIFRNKNILANNDLELTNSFSSKINGLKSSESIDSKISELKSFNSFTSKNTILKLTKSIVLCLIPLLIFVSGTIGYAEVNNHYFGVSEINTRNGGEIGDFWENLLKIEDTNKSTKVWVPVSTIEKAWAASPTLESRPDLLDNWLHSSWANGDLKQNPLGGDIVAWSLRDSLNSVGLFENEKMASEFFSKVNNELESAFENNELNKSDKIFITSSANGKDLNEIKELKPYILSGILNCMFYTDFIIEDTANLHPSQFDSDPSIENAENILNDNILTKNELNSYSSEEKIPLILGKLDIKIYQASSYLLVILSFISFIGIGIHQIKNKFHNRNINALLGFQFMLLGTVFVQIFAIAWFCSWIPLESFPIMKFYTVSSQGFFVLFEILSIVGVFSILEKNKFKLFKRS